MKPIDRVLKTLLALACLFALAQVPVAAWAEDATSEQDMVVAAETTEAAEAVVAAPTDEQSSDDQAVAGQPSDDLALEQQLDALQDGDSSLITEDEQVADTPQADETEAEAELVTMAVREVAWSDDPSTNTSNIQSALNAARATGTSDAPVEVRLQSGKTYVIGATLEISSNTILNLNGATIKREKSSQKTSMLYTSGSSSTGYSKASNITVKGGTWDANESKLGKILHFTHAQNIKVQNATFIHCRADHVIIFDGVKNGSVTGCTFKDDITHPDINTSCRYANEAVHIDSTTARDGEDSSTILDADETPCNGITVDSCVFDGVCTAAGAHYHKGKGDPQQFNVTVTNNSFKKFESNSTVVTAYNIKGWTVSNNTATNCGASHFARLNGSKNFTISNNTVDTIDVFVIDNGNSGSKLTSNGTLSGNTVTNIKSNAFRASGIASTYTLNNESYTTTRTSIPSTSADYALIYVDTATATMKGCTLTYENKNFSTGDGYIATIKFVNGKFTIQNNKIYNAPFAGLYLEKAKAGSTVTSNTIGYCGRVGSGTNSFTLVLNKCNECSVTKNTLKDCKQGGIYLNSCSKTTVKNNTLTVPSGKDEVKQYNCSGCTVSSNGPQFSGATSMPVGATATYSISGGSLSSSNSSIVSVKDKKLTAKKTGKVTLTLTYNGRKYTKTVKVYSINGKTYEMESSVDSNYVLDIQGGKTADGTQMIVYQRNGGKNQRYQYYLQDDNSYAIRSVKSQKWLTVETTNNKYVVQSAWGKVKNAKTLKWKITVDASNRVTFINSASNKCFDVQGGKTKNSAKIIVWSSNGGLNQKWKLVEKK